MHRTFLIIAAFLGFLGIITGTIGAHVLKGMWEYDVRCLNSFETGVKYHYYHVFAMIASAWACKEFPGKAAIWSGWLFLIGTIIFSGSLYILATYQMPSLGRIAPFGGFALMAGWICLAMSAMNKGKVAAPAQRAE